MSHFMQVGQPLGRGGRLSPSPLPASTSHLLLHSPTSPSSRAGAAGSKTSRAAHVLPSFTPAKKSGTFSSPSPVKKAIERSRAADTREVEEEEGLTMQPSTQKVDFWPSGRHHAPTSARPLSAQGGRGSETQTHPRPQRLSLDLAAVSALADAEVASPGEWSDPGSCLGRH